MVRGKKDIARGPSSVFERALPARRRMACECPTGAGTCRAERQDDSSGPRGESFQVQDAAGITLPYIYFEDEPKRRRFARRLSKDDARRMPQQILRLPELVRIARGMQGLL